MEAMWAWLISNKEWLFSGVGVVVFLWVGRIFFKRKRDPSTQTIRSGGSSINVQAGGDVYFGREKKGSDVE